jgi:uncharacterized RDD family membrane protein YckC
MSEQGRTPPGWYAAAGDPPGTERWWDGTAWVGGPQTSSASTPGWAPPANYWPPPGTPSWPPPGTQGYGAPTYGAPTYGAPGYGAPGYGGAYGQPTYAGWWQRVGASLLDAMIVGVPLAIVFGIVYAALPKTTGLCVDGDNQTYVCDRLTTGASGLFFLLWIAASLAVWAVYFVRPMKQNGQTLGKKIAGVKIVRASEPVPLGYGRVIGRMFATYLSMLPCYLGLLWPLWDDKKQTFHDKICDTIAVRAN